MSHLVEPGQSAPRRVVGGEVTEPTAKCHAHLSVLPGDKQKTKSSGDHVIQKQLDILHQLFAFVGGGVKDEHLWGERGGAVKQGGQG